MVKSEKQIAKRVAENAGVYLKEFQQAQHSTNRDSLQEVEKWKALQAGFVKLNFDGALISSEAILEE